ncbi:MAG: cytochrome c oxidase subunit II [Pseudomonadota bacterium]
MRWIDRAAMLAVPGVPTFAAAAFAGAPEPWQLGFQAAASAQQTRIDWFHDLLLWIITGIVIFVLGLLVYTMWRFRESAHPQPSRITHNTWLEIAWTAVPVIILVLIGIPSFRLIYYLDRTPDAEMTLKVGGHQWYWSYEYPDHGDFKFDSYMIPDADLKPGQKRLLEVDNRVVLPVDTNIRILVTGTDVIHSWLVPALGLQTYATPGRTNEIWVRVERPGVYYGQCNQICGINHGFMPVAVEAVSKEAFQRWVDEAKKKFAGPGAAPALLAAAEAR